MIPGTVASITCVFEIVRWPVAERGNDDMAVRNRLHRMREPASGGADGLAPVIHLVVRATPVLHVPIRRSADPVSTRSLRHAYGVLMTTQTRPGALVSEA